MGGSLTSLLSRLVRRGATRVHLKAAKKDVSSKAIQAAWRNPAPKRLLKSM